MATEQPAFDAITDPDNLMLDASGPMADFKVSTMRVNDKLVICTEEYPIYLTKEQAKAFFNLIDA